MCLRLLTLSAVISLHTDFFCYVHREAPLPDRGWAVYVCAPLGLFFYNGTLLCISKRIELIISIITAVKSQHSGFFCYYHTQSHDYIYYYYYYDIILLLCRTITVLPVTMIRRAENGRF